MYKRLFLVLLCMQVLQPVGAVDWRALFDKFYIDIDSFEPYYDSLSLPKSRKFSFWVKVLNDKSDIFLNKEKLYNKKVWYSLEKYVIDCDNNLMSLKSTFEYDLNYKVIGNYEYLPYQMRWVSIPPGSVADFYYAIFCVAR